MQELIEPGTWNTEPGIWSLGTMFLQLAKRSPRILVCGSFKQLTTFVIVLDVLSKFSKMWNVFFFR